MKVTVTFFLAACILSMTYWAWTLTPSRLEYDPLIGAKANYEDIKKIMNSTDLEFLRRFENLEELAVANVDKKKMEEGAYNRFFGDLKPLQNIKKLIFFCSEPPFRSIRGFSFCLEWFYRLNN